MTAATQAVAQLPEIFDNRITAAGSANPAIVDGCLPAQGARIEPSRSQGARNHKAIEVTRGK